MLISLISNIHFEKLGCNAFLLKIQIATIKIKTPKFHSTSSQLNIHKLEFNLRLSTHHEKSDRNSTSNCTKFPKEKLTQSALSLIRIIK